MSNVEKLAQEIKGGKPKSDELSDIVFGKVTDTSPLTIQVEGRFPVTSNFLILSHAVKELTITMTIDGKTGSTTVFRNLQVGDTVKMLRAQRGQMYYVLERG